MIIKKKIINNLSKKTKNLNYFLQKLSKKYVRLD